MEVLVLVSLGLAAGGCAWIALGGAMPSRDGALVRLRTAGHATRRLVAAACSLRPVRTLATLPSVREEAGELLERSAMLRDVIPDHEAPALLALALILCCLVAGVLARSVVGMAATVLVVFAWLKGRVLARARRRRRELADEMPGVLRTLATALESGHTLVQAIEYVGLHERGLAARPFVRTSLRLRCGMSVEEALDELARELEAPGVDLMVAALRISQRTGSPLRDLLQRSAALVEQQGEFDRMLSVKTAQVRLSVRIVCGLPLAMVFLLAMISPDYQQGLMSQVGMGCLVAATLVDALALLIVRMLMAGVM